MGGVNPTMFLVRPECAADYSAIDEVNRLAFGQEDEARLVRELRNVEGFTSELSLVAVKNNNVVGHLLFSPIRIESPDGSTPAIALAPMSVLPAFQRQGIGSKLVRAGLEACRRLGHKIVVVVGHPDYYPRFGFTPARAKGLKAPFPGPDEAFMALELSPGALEGVSGTVRYPPPFGIA